MFIGREYELNELNNLYKKDGFKFAVVYGRRRVGKTALIAEFCKNKDNIFYISTEQNDRVALEDFSSKVLEVFPQAKTILDYFPTWDKAFEYIAAQSSGKRMIVAIDEYPYIANANPSISSILQKYIDTLFKNTNLFLILCGSSMSFMENQVLGYQSPLYGRRNAQFRIDPFDYYESSLFFPKATDEEKVLAYGAAGGIPQYLSIIAEEKSIKEGIYESFFKKSGHLFEEPENLLKQELREPAVYNSIITAIANGASRLNEISTKTGEESKKCSKYIKSLIELHIVEKEYPLGFKAERNGIYKLKDNMFRFWYRFVPKNITNIESGMGEQVLNSRVMPTMTEYLVRVFEDICIQYLLRRNKALTLPFMFSTIGRWWGNNPKLKRQEEIDILAEYEENAIFGECKWKNEQVGLSVLNELMGKADILNQYKNKTFFLFSKSGFNTELIQKVKTMENVKLVDLAEVYKKYLQLK